MLFLPVIPGLTRNLTEGNAEPVVCASTALGTGFCPEGNTLGVRRHDDRRLSPFPERQLDLAGSMEMI